ncbi:MAG: T9SS type A sorting domain-containing protein [Cryomorphaceae bacterium]|nr:T9SS type A sorting domain-containing protein [Cryomorphaceae bacterium]
MIKHFTSIALIVLFGLQAQAAEGDTIFVNAQQARDLTWFEAYNDWAHFPSNLEFNRVNMQFTMGCAAGGCSDWDYTVLVYLRHRSINGNDTTIERFELARLITPYGGYMDRGQNGFNNNWSHTFTFDVTDFQMLMKDSVEIEVFYQGWSSGFSADITFEMVEGTPPRRVRRIENVYVPGRHNYITPSQFETNVLPEKTIFMSEDDMQAALRFTPSGHGFINAVNCAEFCQRNYYVKVDGQQRFQQLMWRDDCGMNPVYPQGGTWLYDRANWCPGTEVITYTHELTGLYTPGDSLDLDIDIEPIIYTVPSGETPANYNLSAILFTYEEPLRQNDASISRVLSPSNNENYKRFNPSCGTALVELENLGGDTLTSVDIDYGMFTGKRMRYQWTGSLAPMEKTLVDLPFDDKDAWSDYQGKTIFTVWTVDPNGQRDENPLNDAQTSFFDATPTYPSEFRMNFRTNSRGDETHWILRNSAGDTIEQGDNYTANQNVNINLQLAQDCYELIFHDRGKNGLSFWANNDGAGVLRFMTNTGVLKQFNPDFGTRIHHFFTVGFSLNDANYKTERLRYGVYPNPASNTVYFATLGEAFEVVIYDQQGREVYRGQHSDASSSVDVSQLAAGHYSLRITDVRGSEHHKLLVY